MPLLHASRSDVSEKGMTLQSLRRYTTTFGLWAFGVVAITGSLVSLALLIFVPLLSLENELWDRAGNPVKLTNIVSSAAIGVIAIVAARSSDRFRHRLGIAVFVAFIVYGLYDFRLFHG